MGPKIRWNWTATKQPFAIILFWKHKIWRCMWMCTHFRFDFEYVKNVFQINSETIGLFMLARQLKYLYIVCSVQIIISLALHALARNWKKNTQNEINRELNEFFGPYEWVDVSTYDIQFRMFVNKIKRQKTKNFEKPFICLESKEKDRVYLKVVQHKIESEKNFWTYFLHRLSYYSASILLLL